jgi:hypothetical protein
VAGAPVRQMRSAVSGTWLAGGVAGTPGPYLLISGLGVETGRVTAPTAAGGCREGEPASAVGGGSVGMVELGVVSAPKSGMVCAMSV